MAAPQATTAIDSNTRNISTKIYSIKSCLISVEASGSVKPAWVYRHSRASQWTKEQQVSLPLLRWLANQTTNNWLASKAGPCSLRPSAHQCALSSYSLLTRITKTPKSILNWLKWRQLRSKTSQYKAKYPLKCMKHIWGHRQENNHIRVSWRLKRYSFSN